MALEMLTAFIFTFPIKFKLTLINCQGVLDYKYFPTNSLLEVVAAAVLSMSAEVTAARARLAELMQRREDIEAELREEARAEEENLNNQVMATNTQMRQRLGVTRQSSLPAKLHMPNMNHQQQQEGNHFEFPDPGTGYYTHSDDNLDDDNQDQPDHPGWLFSPRSASPQSDAEYREHEAVEPPDPAAIARHKRQNPKVVINLGGVKHEVMWRMLEKRPLTRLGMLAKARTHEDILKLVDAYSLTDNEIYFDRDPLTFNSILNFYRTDHLHVIDELCVLDFAEDLEFWMIKEINLEICCVDKFNTRRDHILAEVEKAKHLQQTAEEVVEDFGDGYFVQYQRSDHDSQYS